MVRPFSAWFFKFELTGVSGNIKISFKLVLIKDKLPMILKYVFLVVFMFPVLPIIYIEGKIIQYRIKKLSEAKGNSGTAGHEYKRNKSILFIGESTMAGVGIAEHQEGFAGTLAKELSSRLKIKISWKVNAKSGFTAKQVTRFIVPEIEENHYDLIIVGLGGNDAFTIRNPNKWIRHIKELIAHLNQKFDEAPIAFLNLPPIKEFPAFSPLMKLTLGNLVLILNEALKKFTSGQSKIYFNPELIHLEKWIQKNEQIKDLKDFFSDGVHPSELTYQLWAKDFSEFLLLQKELKNHLIFG